MGYIHLIESSVLNRVTVMRLYSVLLMSNLITTLTLAKIANSDGTIELLLNTNRVMMWERISSNISDVLDL